MKGFVCDACGFVAIDGQAPEKCPVCAAPKTAFAEKEDAIKTPGSQSIGEPEKKHIPAVTVVKACGLIPDGCTDVHAKVGEILHPMLPEHHIMYLDFYIDDAFVSRVTLTPGKLNPAAALHVKAPSGKVTVVERCNLHGAWMKEAAL